MISISGIKNQKELEDLPYFNKNTAGILIGKEGKNLDAKISQLTEKGYLITLKNGLYVTSIYYEKERNNPLYREYIANILRYPSYLSLEYVLFINNVIPESTYSLTSVTIKSSRTYTNELGTFIYQNMKDELFTGFQRKSYRFSEIAIATKSKALFDYLYLKSNLNKDIMEDLKDGLRINWEVFTKTDLAEFKTYVDLSESLKMRSVLSNIEKIL